MYLQLCLTSPLGFDDAVALFGTIVGVPQTSIMLYAVFHGIGKREELLAPTRADLGLKGIYIAWVLYPIVVCSSKVSLALLISRLTVKHAEGVISVFVAAFQYHCHTMVGNILIQLLIPGLIIMIIWGLQARMSAKITVLMAFSLQLLVVIPTIFRLILLRRMTDKDLRGDRTFAITKAVIVSEVTMHFSLMAATFPCLRKFLQAFDMNLGATTNMTTDPDNSNNSNGTYALKPLDPRGERASVEQWSGCSRHDRKYQPHTITRISAGEPNSIAPAEGNGKLQRQRSDDSQHAMITRTQHWGVKVESRST
ncbi:uncharacterized protein BDW43DRAFT_322105 [Aspergillus alliaceus]|uniref:uncharacterized protein n=1 Tax=Petromyces alliaceus TaxID=209559 RepID=UPI0012A450A9|nr:uncharacterized protein BDW43DRAFT_322105 [Aspergillus alliaceus]KAB8229632.1 hypothetical protein BDW43DRAFT_322105 [Aspergillus alliaceus]